MGEDLEARELELFLLDRIKSALSKFCRDSADLQ
jgi:hypothetical protein